MKKKLIGLLATALMLSALLITLVACGGGGGTSNKQNRNFITLSMWVIWDGHVKDANGELSDDTKKIEAEVEEVFNQISQETYSTKVVFQWFKDEAEYVAALADKYEQLEEAGKPGEVPNVPVGEREGEYPALSMNQLDLVLMLDKDMLTDYVNNERLNPLDSLFTSSGRKLWNEYASIFEYTRLPYTAYDDRDEAIPSIGNFGVTNLNSVGKYTYLLVNKDAANYFHTGLGDTYTSIADCVELIDEVAKYTGTAPEVAGMAPLLAPFDYYRAFFYTPYTLSDGSAAADTFAGNSGIGGNNGLVATFWNKNAAYMSVQHGSLSNALDNKDYMSYIALMNWCTANNKFAAEGQEFAVGVVEGDYELRNEYGDDYYCFVLDNPRMTDEDLFSGMWAISSYTKDESRAMEIIQALQTDKALINALIYGKKDTHYRVEGDGSVTSLGSYYMNPRYAGNMYYASPDRSHGQSVEWLNGRMIQKREWNRDLWVDFHYQNKLNMNRANILQTISNDIFDELYAFAPSSSTVNEYVKSFLAKADELKTTYWEKSNQLGEPAEGASPVKELFSDTWRYMVPDTAADRFQGDLLVTNYTSLSGNVKYWVNEVLTQK